MTKEKDLFRRVHDWIKDDPDPVTATELQSLLTAAQDNDSQAVADLQDRFSHLLQFGTAGLRGHLGGGPARMNLAVVSRAAAGLGRFLTHALPGQTPRVVIGFDARHGSRDFAYASAEILAGQGAEVSIFRHHCPTPVLAFALNHLSADAGVMVTASHNPAGDNGYKVYLGGRIETGPGQGVQIVSPHDDAIAQAIASVESVQSLPRGKNYSLMGPEITDSYIAQVIGLTTPQPVPDFTCVYTPLHGVGGDVALKVLNGAGFSSIEVVEEQFHPDPDFPTLPFPNPEEEGVLAQAIDVATRVNADLVLAHDPDADRLGVAVPSSQGWYQLSGDEIGALLGEMIASTQPDHGVFANSVVSSRLLASIAQAHALTHHETLTGFKWICRTPGLTYGYEEALGYCVAPDIVRDKDGISASLLITTLASQARQEGKTLLDLLDTLALQHGLYATGSLSFRVGQLSELDDLMERLRNTPIESFGDSTVTAAQDLTHGTDTLPPTNALIFTTEAEDRLIVRPSGTEPKLKCYLEVIIPVESESDLAGARQRAHERLAQLSHDLGSLLQPDLP